MKALLKGLGWLLAAVVVIGLIFVGLNWTLLRNMVETKDAKIRDVTAFSPRTTVAGCFSKPLPTWQETTDGAHPIPASVIADMAAYSKSEAGVSMLVLVDGKIVGEDYVGDADQATKTLSFSMHKSVMGLLYGAALADGIIGSLDDPIATYLTEWADDPRGQIPLRAFLTMSSGIKTISFTEERWQAMQFLLSDGVTDAALGLEVREAPYTQFWYANTDSQLVGAALNRALAAAGQGTYQTYLSQKIWCPIGAKDGLLWPESKSGDPRFYAYLEATARDWARVGQLILDDGAVAGQQVLPEGWIDTYTAPSQTNPNYGLQVWLSSPYVAKRPYNPENPITVIQSEPHLADDVIFFDGFGGQRVYVVPSAGLVIVRTGEVSMTWDDAKLVNLALRALADRP